MPETVVNFVTTFTKGPGGQVIQNVEPRVFDFEIDPAAQAYYQSDMQSVLNAFQNIDVNGTGASNAALLDTINYNLMYLNFWTRMKRIENGEQVDASNTTVMI